MKAIELSWGRGLLVWLVASLLWGLAATAFYPVGDAISAIWADAPTNEEMASQREIVGRAYNECMAQAPPEAEGKDAASGPAQVMICNMMKLQAMPSGLARDSAWQRVAAFSVVVLLGSLILGMGLLFAARLTRS